MDARYSVTVDPACGLVLIRLAGFFHPADVADLRARCADEYRKLGTTLGRHVTLIDIAQADIQARDGLDQFAALLADFSLQGNRIAFVVPRSLARSQVRRLAATRNAAFFDDAHVAESWLFDAPTSHAA